MKGGKGDNIEWKEKGKMRRKKEEDGRKRKKEER